MDQEPPAEEKESAAPETSRRTPGEVFDDVTTTAMVKAALLAREGMAAMHINVDTIKGVVHLRGFVRTPKERELAEEIAEIYEGAVVVNELELRPV